MIELLSKLHLDQVKCAQHDEVANFICLDKQCSKRGLSCVICESTYHAGHNFKPLKFFISQIAKPLQNSKSLIIILSQIDLMVSQLKEEFKKVVKQSDQIQLQKAFAGYLSLLNKKINSQLQIDKNLIDFFQSTENLTLQKINSFINNYQLYDCQPELQSQRSLTNQQKYLYQVLDNIKEKKEEFDIFIKNQTEVKEILGLFMISDSKEKVIFQFSEDLHHTAIKITDKKTAKQQHNYSSNFALIEPMVVGKKKSLNKKSVKISINKLNSWINLGICVKSKAVSANYYFSTDDIGHGAYTISNDGYSWHHTDSSLNSFYHGWNFTQGDVIIMTYDPKTKTIKYAKENYEKQFELLCEPILGEEMYFCCTLNTHDEAVSIVQ